MADDIYIDDLATPHLTPAQRCLIAATDEPVLTKEAVLAAARAQTGLTDFGADDFKQRLSLWLTSIKADKGLNSFGRATLFADCVRLATSRAKLHAILQKHPAILDIKIDRPVIIAGLPRSGTTHLVNMLASDARFYSMPLWETLDPIDDDDVTRDVTRDMAGDVTGQVTQSPQSQAESDPRFIACQTFWGQFETLLPYMAAMHEMAPAHVHEDVELMGVDFSGYVIEWLCRAHQWQSHYLACDQTPHYLYAKQIIQYLSWRRARHKKGQPEETHKPHSPARWVMKSPPHMENFIPLLNAYPDARLIITHRDPVAVLQSIITMLAYGDRLRRRDIDLPALATYWIDRIEVMLKRCVRDYDQLSGQLNETNCMNVYFHDYMKDEQAVMKRAYRLAEMELDSATQTAITHYIKTHQRGHKGRVIYNLADDFGVDIPALYNRLQFYFDRFPVKKELVGG